MRARSSRSRPQPELESAETSTESSPLRPRRSLKRADLDRKAQILAAKQQENDMIENYSEGAVSDSIMSPMNRSSHTLHQRNEQDDSDMSDTFISNENTRTYLNACKAYGIKVDPNILICLQTRFESISTVRLPHTHSLYLSIYLSTVSILYSFSFF